MYMVCVVVCVMWWCVCVQGVCGIVCRGCMCMWGMCGCSFVCVCGMWYGVCDMCCVQGVHVYICGVWGI